MYKKIFFILFWSLLLTTKLIAQSIPDGIIFQAMAKDNNGNAANNRTIYAIVSILTTNNIDSKIYTEKFTLTSNVDGIFTLVIGKGNRLSGYNSFNSIVWDKAYFVNVKIAVAPTIMNTIWQEDKEYVDLGTSQFWTVPYAFYSTNAAYTDIAKTISTILPSNKGGTGVDNKGKTFELKNNFSILGEGDLVINTTRNSNITLPYTGTLSTLSGNEVLTNKVLVSPILMGNPSAPTTSLSSRDSSIATTLFVSSLVAQEIGKNSAKLSDNLINSINIIDSTIATKLTTTDTAGLLANYLASLNNLRSTKLNSIDTANLSAWKLNKVDTILLSNRINRKLDTDDFSIMIAPYLTKMNGVSYADTLAMLTNYLAALNNLRGTKVNYTDTANILTNYLAALNNLRSTKLNAIDTANLSAWKLNKADTATMLANYKAGMIALNADTLTLASRFSDVVNLANSKLRIADTATMLANYLASLNNLRETKVNYTDTANILTNYLAALNNLRSTKLNSIDTANLSAWKLNKVDTILLSNRINRKLDTGDFSVMIAPYLTKMNGVSYADTVAMLTNYLAALNNLRSSKLNAIDTANLSTWKLNKADTANMLANYKSSVIDLKDAKLNKSDTANMLANYKAGLIALNADTLTLASRFSDVVNLANTKLNAIDTANLSTWKLNKADTANMLANYKSSVIDLKDAKLNKSDTANMLANYKDGLIALNADTLTLASRFSDVVNLANTKLKITDTANLSAWKLNSVDTIALLQKQDTAAMLAFYAKRFTKDVTLHLATGKSLGKYLNNATIPATGKTLDEFLYDISTESIHPTYLLPVVSLTTSPAGATVEMGYNPGLITLSNIFTQNNGGAVTATTYYKNDVSLGVGITSNSPGTITSNITYKVIVNYAQGPILNDNLGIPDATGRISTGTATSAYITFTPQSKKYWGASNSSSVSNATLITNSEYYASPAKTIFGITISGTQFVYYAYPAIGADLTSILVGGFESINSFTKSIQSVTNSSGYTQNYKVYISNNNFSANLNSIIIQ